MKKVRLLLSILVVAAAYNQATAQVKTLPEVTVQSRNYKYLRAVNTATAAEPVQLLERKAAVYDVKNSNYYQDDYDTYYITFYLPQGYLLATYDESGKLIRTAEKYENISLPYSVKTAVTKRFPNWSVTNDIYVVKYQEADEPTTVYKMTLRNGSKRMKIKTNDKGEFLD